MKQISWRWLFVAGLAALNACGDRPGEQNTSDRFTGKKFNEHIRSTEARTPEEEQAGFVLPEGFEIELFASEPDIGKPMNLTFDAQGRMWVTQSFEYPFPASPGKGSDRITILEDTDGDGRADRFTKFSDTLNIPIGIFPLDDGAVAYSIPNVYRFADNNDDGKAESKEVLLGPFEYRDTHGMVNNFMRGFDGWIHACHGFTNRSTVAGDDGDSITMVSGNTFRFRPDGSRVEHFTHGRINPFGLAYDERGYLYSTDCHTSPLYQLIRGGDYTQWGKEEGMGFAPDMKPLEKEATALCGIAYYADVHFPKSYQSNFYIGDAVASRVYRNSYTFKESTPIGKLEEEFILSEDPWFRPVDVKLGPDGALYIADFYNRIIGHYEVPLNHPQRDRIRGRIWRVTYKGKANDKLNLASASADDLIALLDHDNLITRFTAANQLAERIGAKAGPAIIKLVQDKDFSPRALGHALWVLHRIGALSFEMLKDASYHDDATVRVHAMRIMAEEGYNKPEYFAIATRGLEDSDPHVKRAATELLVHFPGIESLRKAIEMRKEVPDVDSHQLYTTRLMLRDLMRNEAVMDAVVAREWSKDDAELLVDVIVGVPSEKAAVFLSAHLEDTKLEGERLARLYEHLARYIPEGQLDETIVRASDRKKDNVDYQYLAFKGIQQGLDRRGADRSSQLRPWGVELAGKLMEAHDPKKDLTPEQSGKVRFAAELAGKYKIKSLEPRLVELVREGKTNDPEVRLAALRSLLIFDVRKHASLAGNILRDTFPTQFKNRVATLLGDFPGPATNAVLADVKSAPPELQSAIVMSLASSTEGKNIIFRKVRSGDVLPRKLMEPKVQERIMMNISPQQEKEYQKITSDLPPVSTERQTLIATRILGFGSVMNDELPVDSGRLVFKQNCSACHSIANEGGSIGPQLDGVGKWGMRALAEKILDPNRNVSESFRNYTITLKDGKVVSGLLRREEGEVLVLADVTGKEFTVAKSNIKEQKASRYTLMPDHFGEVLSQDEFNYLLKYLLSLQS